MPIPPHPGPSLAAILCGGKGLRMGLDKALLPHPGGGCLLEVAVALARTCAPRVILLSGNGHRYPELGLRELADARPGCGPLGGLVSALREARGDLLLLPVDLPALDPPALATLLAAHAAGAAALTLAGGPDGLHPALSIWSPACRVPAETALAADRLALHALAALLPTRQVPLAARVLRNWNRPEDWGDGEAEGPG